SGARPGRRPGARAHYPGLRFTTDLKEAAAVPATLRVVAAAGAWDRVCLASFSDRRLRVVRRLTGGRVATSLGQRETARLLVAANGGPASGVPTPPGRPAWRAMAVQVPAEFRGVRVVTPGFVRRAHRLGPAVDVWTVDA